MKRFGCVIGWRWRQRAGLSRAVASAQMGRHDKGPPKQKRPPHRAALPYTKAQNSQNFLISRCSAWIRRTVPVTER